MRGVFSPQSSLRYITLALIGLLCLPCMPGKVHAIDFNLLDGRVTGQFSTTASMGLSWRVSSRDQSIIGTTNGGTAFSLNGDDGNLNYDKGDIFSKNFKILHEIAFDFEDYEFYVQGFYFRDLAIRKGEVLQEGRPEISGTTVRFAGRNAVLLDAWVRREFDLGDKPVLFTLGSQVINWGESTFIQNGLNTINPVDVSKLRAAGSEIKEALVPVPALKFDFDLTDTIAIQGFYQLGFRKTRLEPYGTFFSTSDIASPGGNVVLLGFGVDPNVIDTPRGPAAPGYNAPVGVGVTRTGDREASDSGQYGVSARMFSDLFGGAEFGFYYTHLHSRLPLISSITGTEAGVAAGNYGASAEYFLEFPEDIQTFGASFNADLGTTGWAIQGEASLHLDQPLQVDDVEILLASLSPLNAVFGQNQLGAFDYNEKVTGYVRKDVAQAQFTVSRIFPGLFGADQVVVVGELGATMVNEFDDKNQFRYEAVGTYTSGNPFFTSLGIQPGTESIDAFPDRLSMGYRILSRASYFNALGPLPLVPQIAYYDDFKGTSPVPVANFIEGRKTLSLSVGTGALGLWDVRLGYTNSFGGGRYNLLNDRDFMSLTASYSF